MAIRLLSNETINGTLVITKGITTGSATGGNSGSVTIAGGINQSFRGDGSTVTYGSHTNTATATGTTDASAFLISQKNTGGTAIEYRQGVIADGNAFFGKWQSGSITGIGLNVATGNVTFSGTMTVAGGVVMNGNQTVQGNLTVDGTVTGTVAIFNSGATNVIATFTSTDATGVIQIADNNGNVEIGASGNNFIVSPAGGVAQLTVGSSSSTFAGSVTGTTAIFSGSGTILSLNRNAPGTALIELKIANTIEGYLGATTTKSFVVYNEAGSEKAHVENNGNIGLYGSAINFLIGDFAEINFRESGAITIDSDNNQSSRNFQIKDGSGSSLLTVLDTGNVGIGVTSPNARLHVDHPANPTSIRIGSNTTDDCWVMFNTDGNDWSIGTDRSDSNKFKISDYSSLGTNDRLVIDTTGNVGIGAAPGNYKLDVTGGGRFTGFFEMAGGGCVYQAQKFYLDGGGDTFLESPSSNLMTFTVGATERMRIRPNGTVGIGIDNTGNSNVSLRVVNNINSDWVAEIKNTNTAGNTYGLVVNTLAGAGAYNLGCYTHTGNGFFVRNDGKVGIGTGTPQTTLEVNGAASALNAHFGQGTNNSSGVFGGISLGYSETGNAGYRKVAIVAQATGDGAARQNLVFLVDSAADGNSASIADNKMILNYNGQIKIGNGSNIAISTNAQHYHAAGPSGLSMREYEGHFDIANGTSLDLFENSSAYSDIQMVQISIVMYHSSRTYFAGMGTIGGYGMALTGAGIGQSNGGLTSAAVSTGIRKLQLTNNAGFNASARIYIQIRSESAITVHNGSISAPY
jgi:hypothetical protein